MAILTFFNYWLDRILPVRTLASNEAYARDSDRCFGVILGRGLCPISREYSCMDGAEITAADEEYLATGSRRT